MSEFEYGRLWKAYILATVGNWLLDIYGPDYSRHTTLLDGTLKGLSLRTADVQARTIFRIVMDKIGQMFRWRSAEVEFSIDAEGKYAITPRVESGNTTKDIIEDHHELPVETALSVLNQCLKDVGNICWVALDRLDEAFQGLPEVEIPALRALLRTYLDLKEFDRIKLKLFLRRDLFRRIIEEPFVNLTHINSSKVEIFWNDEDLRNLLLRRAKQNKQMLHLLGEGLDDEALFAALFPEKVDVGKRQPKTWVWIMRRVRDGNNVKPPRNLIDLVSLARDEQIKREDRSPREWAPGIPLIESEALRTALTQLSENRVQDTLFAEAGVYAKLIRIFEGTRAEHNEISLGNLLGLEGADLRAAIKPLVELGFLEFIRATGTYKIPTLYRAGLSVTQGKAFGAAATSTSDGDEEDEDED